MGLLARTNALAASSIRRLGEDIQWTPKGGTPRNLKGFFGSRHTQVPFPESGSQAVLETLEFTFPAGDVQEMSVDDTFMHDGTQYVMVGLNLDNPAIAAVEVKRT